MLNSPSPNSCDVVLHGTAGARTEDSAVRLSHRVRHLERLEALAHPSSVMERLQIAFNDAALRLTGKGGNEIRDAAEAALISADLQISFLEKLSEDDLASLVSGLEVITKTEGVLP